MQQNVAPHRVLSANTREWAASVIELLQTLSESLFPRAMGGEDGVSEEERIMGDTSFTLIVPSTQATVLQHLTIQSFTTRITASTKGSTSGVNAITGLR